MVGPEARAAIGNHPAFLVLFWRIITGAAAYSEDQVSHGPAAVSVGEYLGAGRSWTPLLRRGRPSSSRWAWKGCLNGGGSVASRTPRWTGTLERIHESCELFPEDFPPVEVCGYGGVFSLPGCPEDCFTGGGYLNLELPTVKQVPFPGNQAFCLQAGQDAAESLALYVHFRGKLFLIQRAGRDSFEGYDCGPCEAQGCKSVVVAALDQAGRCSKKQVAVPDVGLGV